MTNSVPHDKGQTTSGKGRISRVIFFAVGLTLMAEQVGAGVGSRLPVDVVNGPMVEVRGAFAERDESGLHARGWVKRKLGRFGPIRSHLHVEGLDAQGVPLKSLETQWRGNLPARPSSLAPFSANFSPLTAAQIKSVRISVQPGVRHDVKD